MSTFNPGYLNSGLFYTGTNPVIQVLFPSNWPSYWTGYVYSPTDIDPSRKTFTQLTADQQSGISLALSMWSNYAGITFTGAPTPDGKKISFGITPLRNASGVAFYPMWTEKPEAHGDVFFDTLAIDQSFLPTIGSATGRSNFSLALHEIGHALGLVHDFSGTPIPASEANTLYTVMSYNDYTQGPRRTPITPMLYDIAQLQRVYGANTNYNSGDTSYLFTDTTHPFTSAGGGITARPDQVLMTLWDGGGNDKIDASAVTTSVKINLNPGEFSAIGTSYSPRGGDAEVKNPAYNVGIAFGTIIENAIGGIKDDVLVGNDADNRLEGRAGNDRLEGGLGIDTLVGGADNDTLDGGAGNDLYEFSGPFGSDTIRDTDGTILLDGVAPPTGLKVGTLPGSYRSTNNRVSYTLAPATNGTTQNLVITVTGPSKGTITVQGWSAGQLGITLSETPAATTPTTHSVSGTCSDDRLFAPNPAALTAGPTTDFHSDLSRARLARLVQLGIVDPDDAADAFGPAPQNLTTDTPTLLQGQDGNDLAAGRSADDVIDGGTGDDLLLGGLGADTIRGGSGADWIFGSGSGAVGTLRDPVPVPSGSTVLTRGYGWVVYADASGTPVVGDVTADALLGDAGNLIDGGAGNDHIDAGSGDDIAHGGDDNDTVYGLAGNDTLFGDAGNDTLFGDGVVRTGTLESVAGLDHGNDVLIGGADTDNLFGDGGDDELYGGDDNDFIYGDQSTLNRGILPQQFDGNDYLDGGAGNDWMEGGQRDDTLFGGVGDDTMFGDGAANAAAYSMARAA